ncbi:MAG: phosphate ABC transporter permease subunit PstC, partial [Sulfuriferula sp.]
MSNPLSTHRTRRFMWQDKLFRSATRVFAFIVLALLIGILVSLVMGSMPAIRAFGFGFLTDSSWNPVTEKFGA